MSEATVGVAHLKMSKVKFSEVLFQGILKMHSSKRNYYYNNPNNNNSS